MCDDDYVKLTCANLVLGALTAGFWAHDADAGALITGLICLTSAVYFIAALITERLNDD